MNRVPLAVVCVVIALSTTMPAQIPEATWLSASRADQLTGLYHFDNGDRIHVTDLHDLLGHSVLSVTEYSTGRLRGLYPAEQGSFSAGSSWFRRTPESYVLRFDERRSPVPSLVWTENGVSRTATRVPLTERDVTFIHNGVTIAGTLALPAGPGPHPAIVMIPGSGPLTRRTLRLTGDFLAAEGLAVFTPDKRGTGKSSGDWNGLSHAAWAADVQAQVDWLKAQPGIDPTRLGLYAGSEGGFIGPVVAATRTDIRFLVCRVCSALPHGPVIVDMETGAMRHRGVSESDTRLAGDLLTRMIRYATDRTGYDELVAAAKAGEGTPWRAIVPMAVIPLRDAPYWDRYRGVLTVDPRESYSRLRIPVLAILGERDERILVDAHAAAFRRLTAAGADLTLWIEPGASHGLLLDEASVPRYPGDFYRRLADWVRGVVSATVSPSAPQVLTDRLSAFDGEWIFVEDLTEGRALEQLGPPMASTFTMRVDGPAIVLNGHGSGHRDVRIALDGSITEIKEPKTITRYRGTWKDATFEYDVAFERGQGSSAGIGLIRRRFRMTPDGLLVSVVADPPTGKESVGLYRHAQDIVMPAPAKAVIGDLAWLAGAWVGTRSSGSSIEERWSPPRGGAMLAISRTVNTSGNMSLFEYLRIVERDGGLVYIAQPGGRAPTEFVLTESGNTRAVFENPRHDYPRRIVYELSAEGGLIATIGQTKGGTPTRFDFKREEK